MKYLNISGKSGALSLLLFVLQLFLFAPAAVKAVAPGTQITFDGGWKWATNWSPNGKWITYVQTPWVPWKYNIYIVPSEGGTPVNLTSEIAGNCVFPKFTHDSREVIFTNMVGAEMDIMSVDISQLSKKNPKTIQPKYIMRHAANGAFSHGGRYLAYSSMIPFNGGNRNWDFRVYDCVKKTSWSITPDLGYDPKYGFPIPSWSHNDSHVITALPVTGGWFLYSIPREGGAAELLEDQVLRTWDTDASSDGRWVLFDNWKNYSELYVVNISTKIVTSLFPGQALVAYCPSLSPNGKEFCYSGAVDWTVATTHGLDIYVTDFNPYVAKLARKAENAPAEFALSQNYPNPFNPSTAIQYTIPADKGGLVKLIVYDTHGALVRILVNASQGPGVHSVVWDGADDMGRKASSGIYIYKLKIGELILSRKMILLR